MIWGQHIEWRVDGQVVPGQQVSISRAEPKRFIVELWDTTNPQNANKLDTMIVWIVWATLAFDPGLPKMSVPAAVGNQIGKTGSELEARMITRATIEPPAMFNLNEDVPDLRGAPLKPDLPGEDFAGRPLKDGVNARWDMARRFAVRSSLTDANGVPRNWPGGFGPGDDPLDYPDDPLVANDDGVRPGRTEDNNPYDGELDKLYDEDFPNDKGPGPGFQYGGYVGDRFVLKLYFQQFVRLQLGPQGAAKWLIVSDAQPWRVEMHFKKLGVTEKMWEIDGNQQNGLEKQRVLRENDAGIPQEHRKDWNGDGVIDDREIGGWFQDPDAGSFARPDNAGYP